MYYRSGVIRNGEDMAKLVTLKTFRIEQDLLHRVLTYAHAHDTTFSAVLRAALSAYLTRDET